MRQLKRQDRTKDMHLERQKRETSVYESPTFTQTVSIETDNKPATDHKPKLSQTEVKVEPIHKPKLSQTEVKVEPIKDVKIKLESKVEPQPEPIHKPKLSQTEVKVEPIGALESLVGLQRDSLLFLFDSCLNSGSKVSGAITISNLAVSLESTVAAVRKAIQRLEQKGYISRNQFKDGRGGWTKYELPHGIYTELLSMRTRAKVEPKLSHTRAKVEPQPEPQPEPSPLGSKVDNIINNYLTNTDDWNFEMLHNIEKFGITSSVLKRAREISPSLQIDQASLVIEKFSVRMESDAGRSIKNPIGYFLSLTKKAASGEDILPEIETESDRLMREMVEKAQDVLKKRAEIEAELLESSFLVWMGGLDSAKKREIAPNSTLVKEGSYPYTQHFKNYYKENLWPKEKEIMLQGKA